MFSIFYKLLVNAKNRLLFHLWFHAKNVVVRLCNDPSCAMPVHGRMLHMPLSHALPLSIKLYPFYDKLPTRLSNFIFDKYGELRLIDVGANIGDTIAAFNQHSTDRFLAVEPNPHFNAYLQTNYGTDPNVTILSYMCTAADSTGSYAIQEHSGTASLERTEGGLEIPAVTIEELVKRYPAFENFNVIKIDTDGYDFEVIRGAKEVLPGNLPALLFECYDNGNPRFVDDCLDALSILADAGYESFLLYDRLGYLMGRYFLHDLSHFKELLRYQVASNMICTDILVLKREDMEQFYRQEISVFQDVVDKVLSGAHA